MKTKPYPKTPELDKMKAVQNESQIIGAFLDTLGERNLTLAEYDDNDRLWPTNKRIEQILADYFEIDLNRVEKERRAILESLR